MVLIPGMKTKIPCRIVGTGSSVGRLVPRYLILNNPLSLHVHPDAEQAAIGWRNEELDRRMGRDASLLDYSDSNCKNELYYALTPSTLMCGFRDFDSTMLGDVAGTSSSPAA